MTVYTQQMWRRCEPDGIGPTSSRCDGDCVYRPQEGGMALYRRVSSYIVYGHAILDFCFRRRRRARTETCRRLPPESRLLLPARRVGLCILPSAGTRTVYSRSRPMECYVPFDLVVTIDDTPVVDAEQVDITLHTPLGISTGVRHNAANVSAGLSTTF